MARMRGLYPIVDLDTLAIRGITALDFARAVLAAGPALLQLRAKHQTAREVLTLLTELKPLCANAGTLLFVNDRPDLALLTGADGVHVGQEDLPVAEVRKLPGKLRVGVSTHSIAQLKQALETDPDYVALGPIFPTTSKQRAEPALGLETLTEASALAAKAGIPLVAIGGIQSEHAPAIARAGALGAVILDLLADGGDATAVQARAQKLHALLGG